MKIKPTLKIGGRAFVTRSDHKFSGIIIDMRENWIRIAGEGRVSGSLFDEWFPLNSKSITVKAAI